MDGGLKFGVWIKRMLFFAVFLRNKCPVSAIKRVGGMTCAAKTFGHCRGKKSKVVGPKLNHKIFFSAPMILLQFSGAFIRIFFGPNLGHFIRKNTKKCHKFQKMVVFKTNKKSP